MNQNNPARWRALWHRNDQPVEHENDGEFDELVIADWLHVERMDEGGWWLRVGDARLWAEVDAEGNVTLTVERGAYGEVRGETKTHEPPGKG